MSCAHYLSYSTFYIEKVAQTVTFQKHLIPHLSTKQNKQDITLITRHHTTPQHDSCRQVASIATVTLLQRV